MTDQQSAAGFQGSETSTAEVIIYGQGEDPIILGADATVYPFDGRYRVDNHPSLISVNTSKGLTGTGTFQIVCKPPRGLNETLFERIVDDDWVDIVFRRHGRVWHTMRGLVNGIRRRRTVGGRGATGFVYTISGFDFQRVFELTPLWFNRFALENLEGSYAQRVYSILPTIGGSPSETVNAILIGWFETLQATGRGDWLMPTSMPSTLSSFADNIAAWFNDTYFTNVPERISISPNLAEPSGTVWSLAQEWGDPAFCELFCDLGNRGAQPKEGEELTVEDSTMSVFFRDRPFPLTTSIQDDQGSTPTDLGLGKQSAWFDLPLHTVPRQQIKEDDIGRTGEERLNAFMVSPQMSQELYGTGTLDVQKPLWDEEDMKRHGFRRYDIMTRYKAKDAKLINLSVLQRYMIRDWFAINPYLLNGTLSLGVGRPDIRIGTRIRIPGDSGENSLDETYYVEQVNHNWVFGPGLKTSLQVTRGFIGTDDDLIDAMNTLADRYVIPT